MHLEAFPGGATVFEAIARYCYGFDLALNPDSIAHIFCGARYLRMPELEETTERYMLEEVLPTPAAAARVLRYATQIAYQDETVMVDVVGRCINGVAAAFGSMTSLSDLHELPPDCFACIIRTAAELGQERAADTSSQRGSPGRAAAGRKSSKRALEEAVVHYLRARMTMAHSDDAPNVEQLTEVLSSAGKVAGQEHASHIFSVLELLLDRLDAEQAEELCFALHGIGFWNWLSHDVLERVYADRRIPDRYCTVALMAENRRLLAANKELEERVRDMSHALETEHKTARGSPPNSRGTGRGDATRGDDVRESELETERESLDYDSYYERHDGGPHTRSEASFDDDR